MKHAACAVIGKGLIGSAAARHLAEAGHEVMLIGPDEPAEAHSHGGVFASHHDAARITRILDREPIWAELARRSLARHDALETATGIRFHHPHPVLHADVGSGDLTDAIHATRALLDPPLPSAEDPWVHPALHLPAAARVHEERGPAGWLSPRRLVQAQTLAALAAGARVLRTPAWALREADHGIRIILDDGSEVSADTVLVCAGAFSAPVGLVDGLPMWTEGRSVVLARVADELADTLEQLPCLMLDAPEQELSDLYLMPALRYPDGDRYVKIGTSCLRHRIDALDELQQWFRAPAPPDDVERLTRALVELVPALEDADLRTANCAVTLTASGRPIIDWTLAGRIAFAGGGNGKAAKSSDEIGRLAAGLVAGTASATDLAPFSR